VWTFSVDSFKLLRVMQQKVLICECNSAGLIDRSKLATICASLKAAGVAFDTVPDLCGAAATRDASLKHYSGNGPVRIVACYPRAVKALFEFANAPLSQTDAQILNLREVSGDEALSTLGVDAVAPQAPGEPAQSAPANGWIPWFPVLDMARCTNCQQCLGFCLFGVYGLSEEGKVKVINPQGCKTNCPACARICPEVAIIFPKYASGAIAGAEITDETREKDRIQADMQQILGSDVYTALAQRRQKARQRQLLRTDLLQAHQERREYLERSRAMPPHENPLPPVSGV